jgi:hypothetical protein
LGLRRAGKDHQVRGGDSVTPVENDAGFCGDAGGGPVRAEWIEEWLPAILLTADRRKADRSVRLMPSKRDRR